MKAVKIIENESVALDYLGECLHKDSQKYHRPLEQRPVG